MSSGFGGHGSMRLPDPVGIIRWPCAIHVLFRDKRKS
jgi:hypothetical protein